jgi:2-hydroxy-6-oxo-6-(2'-aminophenyl)hexa-2,4-dienoate hydrolase
MPPMPSFDPTQSGYDDKFVDAGDIRTRYIEAGAGAPVVLVHGGGPGADGWGNWYACFPHFARNFRAIAVDMLGFGKTAKPSPESFEYSQDARTHHLIGFIEALGAGPVSLIGNSMGGITSMGVAIERPDLVNKLVLMGPAGLKTDEVPAAVRTLIEYDGSADGMRKVIGVLTHDGYPVDEALVGYRVEGSNDPETRAATHAAMQWVRARHGLYFDDDVIRRVTAPTLVVGGKDDPIVPPSMIFRFLELIEDSWAYILPHCGHWVMNERPEEFSAVTSRFLLQ